MSLNGRVKNLENKGAKYGSNLALVIRRSADRVVRLNLGESPEQACDRLGINQGEESILFIERGVIDPQDNRV